MVEITEDSREADEERDRLDKSHGLALFVE